jgi:predicted transposase/invertase (TIGR01784 family)
MKEVMIIGKLLNPKLDYVFKRIFGYQGNEKITKSFIEAITKEKIYDIILDCNPITEKDLYDDKLSILDIKAKLNNNINCNIEMQIVDRKNIEKRILYYWSKMYTSTIKVGEDFDKLEKGIVILISDYNLDKLSKLKKLHNQMEHKRRESVKF